MVKTNTDGHMGAKGNRLLKRFSGDAELLTQHGVTEEELELLKTVSLFGNLSNSRDIAFILKNIRGDKPAK
ncbi:MAG TPA: hypothetical protein VN867_13070 [Candidatus Binataceae bacterium]|nr:hypothetical protein [Candidatus Binataceae bacterium]